MRPADAVAVELATMQCGAFARWQLQPRGMTDGMIRSRTQDGRWLTASPGVYVLAGVPNTFEQRLWVGWLAVGPGGLVSHEAAAELHGIPNVARNRVTLISAHGWHHQLADITVHQIDDVLNEHRTSWHGLPLTTPARTIVDLASSARPARLLRIVEDSKHARIATYAEVGACMTSVARRGKPGVAKLTRVLDRLTGTRAKTMSTLERQLFELVDTYRLDRPKSQFPFPGRQLPNGCVDAAYVDAKLIIEVDSRSWHTRIAEIKRDHERDAEAARNGWQTLRILYEHVVDDPAGTAALIADVRAERLRQLA
jgi:very-short-patch-repair endonuclease